MSSRERPGRPAGDGSNRERVRTAAREEFAAAGFRGATMRSIAARAGVDIALLSHYFGNKDGLFAATLELPEGARGLLVDALSGPAATQGERLTRSYLALWETPVTSVHMHALARSALSNDAASDRMQALFTGTVSDPAVSALLAGRRVGFTLAMGQLLGVAFARHLFRVPGLVDLDLAEVVRRTAPAVQRHLETPDDRAASGTAGAPATTAGGDRRTSADVVGAAGHAAGVGPSTPAPPTPGARPASPRTPGRS
jgi:AcrR family transcriptional regulator